MLPRRILVAEDDVGARAPAAHGRRARPRAAPRCARMIAAGDVTEDAVLGGRLRLRQPQRGHRVGHDAILLAAATARRARASTRSISAPASAPPGWRWRRASPALTVTLVEIDPALAALARENAERNDLGRAGAGRGPRRCRARARVRRGRSLARIGRPRADESAVQRSGTPATSSPDPRPPPRPCGCARYARRAGSTTAARLLRPRGTLTLIWRADGLADVLARLAPGFGAVDGAAGASEARGSPAIRVLVRAAKASRAPLALLPGLVLNDRAGQPTRDAEAVLRAGSPLPWERAELSSSAQRS